MILKDMDRFSGSTSSLQQLMDQELGHLGENLLLENNLTGTQEVGSSDLFSTAMADLQNYNYLELNPENNEKVVTNDKSPGKSSKKTPEPAPKTPKTPSILGFAKKVTDSEYPLIYRK